MEDENICQYICLTGNRRGLKCGNKFDSNRSNYCKIHEEEILSDVIFITEEDVPNFLKNSELYRNEIINNDKEYPIPKNKFSLNLCSSYIIDYLDILSYWDVDLNYKLFSCRDIEYDILSINENFSDINDLNFLAEVIELFFKNVNDELGAL